MKTSFTSTILVVLFIVSINITSNAQTQLDTIHTASKDFDFIIGSWEITNKILKERLNNSDEWIESKAFSKCWKILDGNGNMDEFNMESRNGKKFIGNTIRIYHPKTRDWSLYWVDNWNLNKGLTLQTRGSFKNNVGAFYGEELYNDIMVKIRFIWKKVDNNTAYWDQAYYDQKKEMWETNWIMEFKRIPKE